MPLDNAVSKRYWSSAPARSSSDRLRSLTTPARRPAARCATTGVEIVLVNSNPATIMTDTRHGRRNLHRAAHRSRRCERIIEKEKPDSLLAGLGGQTGLTLCHAACTQTASLTHTACACSAPNADAIDKAEDRAAVQGHDGVHRPADHPLARSSTDVEDGARTLRDDDRLPRHRPPRLHARRQRAAASRRRRRTARYRRSRPRRCRRSRRSSSKNTSSAGRRSSSRPCATAPGNAIAVCSMENFDPVGVHTGDSHRRRARAHSFG